MDQIQPDEKTNTESRAYDRKRSYIIRHLKTASDLLQKDIPDPKVYIGIDSDLPFLVEGTCILSAKPKLGKSWLALSMCLAVARGKDFLGYKTRQCSTLYLDLESDESLQQKRIRKALRGEDVPPKFYIDSETNSLNNGFVEQIEAYLQEDPDIGIVVIDVFPIIRTESKNRMETEYAHAYRDITPLNKLALTHHISIILVCHDRKAVDTDDPFANILGSTGLQGAVTQMIVMFRRTKNDPIHISVKGKTIDGYPEINAQLKDAEWTIVDGVDGAEKERLMLLEKYRESVIRQAVIEIVNDEGEWRGRAGDLIHKAMYYEIWIEYSSKDVGGFLHKFRPHFMAEDGIMIDIIKNGTGASIYKLSKPPLMTVDE